MNLKVLLLGAAALAVSSVAAQAGWIYDNLNLNPSGADCSFSTTCAADAGRGDDFAAQLFSLSSSATLSEGGFYEVDFGTTSSSVNWAFYDAAGGLPSGSALVAGNSALTATTVGSAFGGNLTLLTFDFSSVVLGPGNYDLAIQAVSPVFGTYLASGLSNSGAAETQDGGATWSSNYEGLSSVSVAVGNAVPEPSTWAMMGVGFAGLAFAGYRSRRSVVAAA
jgi:hypothetical protein